MIQPDNMFDRLELCVFGSLHCDRQNCLRECVSVFHFSVSRFAFKSTVKFIWKRLLCSFADPYWGKRVQDAPESWER